ncbi:MULTISPECIES: hypothetical protein [Streptomyces]|uniref:hypothetical protein n=1 Tax=Streptomyces TaxID=1883 RepID=UPI00163C87BC|nr:MULTISPECIES: hypothetical protein [Streptomyces]MBC2877610.1 hypothetical protein [Streptomyces sp. TYQ1024]UBI36156.1 hypothetical protein K7I03_06570 [Streptomyces mobaraensis]UKW28751.1 hypothetical protein MCU78_06555 [Streptomyces sp. TYQ1024]
MKVRHVDFVRNARLDDNLVGAERREGDADFSVSGYALFAWAMAGVIWHGRSMCRTASPPVTAQIPTGARRT